MNYRRSGNFRVKNISCVNFMALNFRKADRLRKIFNRCEITMETFVVCPRLPRVPAHLDGCCGRGSSL